MFPTRHIVAISSLNSGLVGLVNFPVTAGTPQTFPIDVDALTNDFYVDFAASPPEPFGDFNFVMGSFVNVMALAGNPGVEIQIDESIDGSGTTPAWVRTYTQTMVPGIVSKVDGWRINQSFARVVFANMNASGTVFLSLVGVKLVTI